MFLNYTVKISSQGEEIENLKSVVHSQGEEIDHLKSVVDKLSKEITDLKALHNCEPQGSVNNYNIIAYTSII